MRRKRLVTEKMKRQVLSIPVINTEAGVDYNVRGLERIPSKSVGV